MSAANLVISLTLQAHGCSLKLWNTHKNFLKKHFRRTVQQVKAQRQAEQENGDHSGQQRAEEEPPPMASGHHSSNDGGEASGSSHQCAT